jgi:hypothetical protein
VRVHGLDRRDLLLEELRRRAAIALERELHVLGGDGLAVVELGALAEQELGDETVRGQGPGLGEAGRHRVAGHRLHQRVVQRVEDHEGSADPRGLRGVEPGRRQGDVYRPGELARRRRHDGWHGERNDENEHGDEGDEQCDDPHDRPLLVSLGRISLGRGATRRSGQAQTGSVLPHTTASTVAPFFVVTVCTQPFGR